MIEKLLKKDIIEVLEDLYGIKDYDLQFKKTRKEFDGDITLVSIRKPGFVGNLNDAPSTIQSTMDDVLNNSPSKSRPVYNPENNE